MGGDRASEVAEGGLLTRTGSLIAQNVGSPSLDALGGTLFVDLMYPTCVIETG